uniref:ribonuclease H n=1 Tax=Astatotilapia calliptera TaxID=8154 RepID=A0AAX7U003_ASTCA
MPEGGNDQIFITTFLNNIHPECSQLLKLTATDNLYDMKIKNFITLVKTKAGADLFPNSTKAKSVKMLLNFDVEGSEESEKMMYAGAPPPQQAQQGDFRRRDRSGDVCFYCGIIGHWRTECKSAAGRSQPQNTGPAPATRRKQSSYRQDTDNSYVFSALCTDTMEKEHPLCQLDASAENELNIHLTGIPRHTLCQKHVQTPLPGSPMPGSHIFVSLTLFNNMITAHTSEGQTVVLSHNSDIGYDITAPCRHIDLTYPIHCTISAVTLPAEYQNMTLWSRGENDVGFIDCTPYHAQLKNNKPVYVKQYPISAEKAAALDIIIGDLLTAGVIKPTVSPYNTPVNPVPKPNKPGVWRFTQDLRQVNAVIMPLPPLVPDVPSILTSIPATATHFTVVDLCSAFFSVPVHKDTQPIFAFTHRDKQYTWTRLPQGMVDSPAAFSMVVRATLDGFTPPEGCTLIQYVDDLLLCAESEKLCQTATHMLLQHLQQTGHKASAKKMQYCQTSVQYLGFTLSHGQRSMTTDRVKAVTSVPKPTTQKEMLSFLGMVNYCRQWIPDCSFHDHILRECCKKDKPPRILWSTEM